MPGTHSNNFFLFTTVIVGVGGAALSDVVQELLHLFQEQVPADLAQATHPSQAQALVAQGSPGVGWQCKAASAVIVLCEVLYGASLGCSPHATLLPPNPSQPQGGTSSHQRYPHQHHQRSSSAQQQSSKAKQDCSQALQPSTGRQDVGSPQQRLSQPNQCAHETQSQPCHIQQQASDQLSDSDTAPAHPHILQQQHTASLLPPGHPQVNPPGDFGVALSSNRQGTAALSAAPSVQLSHAVHAELEQLISRALEEFSNAGVWRLPTHQDTDLAASRITALTPQVSCLLCLQITVKLRQVYVVMWTLSFHGTVVVWQPYMHA